MIATSYLVKRYIQKPFSQGPYSWLGKIVQNNKLSHKYCHIGEEKIRKIE